MKYYLAISTVLSLCFSQRLIAQLSADTSNPRQTMRSLRMSKTPPGTPAASMFYLTDPEKQGIFVADPGDRASNDDSAMTLVTASGIRLKRVVDGNFLNVRWFGASGNGGTDDWAAIQKAITYILDHDRAPRALFFPAGAYRISRPLLLAKLMGNTFRQVSITLEGPANSKDLSTGTAMLLPTFSDCFAIGVQLGKGVIIKDLLIKGKFAFPGRLNQVQIDTLNFNEWKDGVTRDNPTSPYAGIVIDPFSDPAVYTNGREMYPGFRTYYIPGLNRSGSTAVQVIGCSITNFIVGVMITPSNQQNGELIDVIDCDISDNKVAYAMGQAQSKECHVLRLKSWGATHTLFDNIDYGVRQGDGAAVPMVDGANIAGFTKQLCNIAAPSFSGSFRNIYAEGLFRLGFVGGAATTAFEDCQLDFSTQGPGIPYPDYFILGSGASFHGCILRHYMGGPGMRMILSGTGNNFEGGTMNEPPVTAGVNNCGHCPVPLFRNVVMYYSGGVLGNSNYGITTATKSPAPYGAFGADPVYYGNTYLFEDPFGTSVMYRYTYHNSYERTIQLNDYSTLHVDYSKWTGYFKLNKPAEAQLLQKGDIILTFGLPYEDFYLNQTAQTYPVGFVDHIENDIVYLRNLAVGIREGARLPLWMNYYVYEKAAFTGNIAAGSNTLTNVQGAFPAPGDRPDIPMVARGTYVTAVDPASGTIRLSTPNTSGKDWSDYTFMNGYPLIEMFSTSDLPALQRQGKTLPGGAYFYRSEPMDRHTDDPAYLMGGRFSEKYYNYNTHIGGDTTFHKLRYTLISK